MSNAPSSADVADSRKAAIEALISSVRAICGQGEINRAMLEKIQAEMMKIAARGDLFPEEEFPSPPRGEKGGRHYKLHEGSNGEYALYFNSLNPGHSTVPHDHTTWAVISAVRGEEVNRLYQRLDDGSVPGKAKIRLQGEVTVRPGTGLSLMPEDIHAIEIVGDAPTRHLHIYGMELGLLDDRMAYDMETGTMEPYNQKHMHKDSKIGGKDA